MRINFLEVNGTVFLGESFTSCKEMSWTSDEIDNLWFCVQTANQNEEENSKKDRVNILNFHSYHQKGYIMLKSESSSFFSFSVFTEEAE